MKYVLISIRPKECELIASGREKIIVQKSRPKLETPFICYIYCTQDNHYNITKDETDILDFNKLNIFISQRKVIGEFVCDFIDETYPICNTITNQFFYTDEWVKGMCNKNDTCLTVEELNAYGKGKPLYGWHISDLKIYDKPKELGDFKFPCQKGYNDMNNAWCYRERGIRLTMCKYNDMKNGCCKAYLTRPPKPWCYTVGNW